jgi:hypothetical protein
MLINSVLRAKSYHIFYTVNRQVAKRLRHRSHKPACASSILALSNIAGSKYEWQWIIHTHSDIGRSGSMSRGKQSRGGAKVPKIFI